MGATHFDGVVTLDTYAQYILGLGITEVSPDSPADFEGPCGERYQVVHGSAEEVGQTPYRLATSRGLSDVERQELCAVRVRDDVAEAPAEHLAISVVAGTTLTHAPCLLLRDARKAPVQVVANQDVVRIPAEVAELDSGQALNWVSAVAESLAKAARTDAQAVLAAGESVVDFQLRVPRIQVCFLQHGLSATSLCRSLSGEFKPPLGDILRSAPGYVMQATLGVVCTAAVIAPLPRSTAFGRGRLLIPGHPDVGSRGEVPLGTRQQFSSEDLVSELDSWVQQVDALGSSAWQLLWVHSAPTADLLPLLEPLPCWPGSIPRVELAVRVRLRLSREAALEPAALSGCDMQATMLQVSLAEEFAEALQVDKQHVAVSAVEPTGDGGCYFEAALLAPEKQLMAACLIASTSEDLEMPHAVPLEQDAQLVQRVRELRYFIQSGRLAENRKMHLLRHADPAFPPLETERLFITDLAGMAEAFREGAAAVRILLRTRYMSDLFYAYHEQRYAAEKELAAALLAADSSCDESAVSRLEAAIGQLEISGADAELLAQAEAALRDLRLRLSLRDLEAAIASENEARIRTAIEAAKLCLPSHLVTSTSERALADRVDAAEQLLVRMRSQEELALFISRGGSWLAAGSPDAKADVEESFEIDLENCILHAQAAGVDASCLQEAKALIAGKRLQTAFAHAEPCLRFAVEAVHSRLYTLHGALDGGLADDRAITSACGEGMPDIPEDLQSAVQEMRDLGSDSATLQHSSKLISSWNALSRLWTALEPTPGTSGNSCGSVAELEACIQGVESEFGDTAQSLHDENSQAYLRDALSKCHELRANWLESERANVQSELLNAIRCGDVQAAENCISKCRNSGTALNLLSPNGEPLPHLLARTGNCSMLRRFSAAGLDFQSSDGTGNTPLDIAIEQMLAGAAPVQPVQHINNIRPKAHAPKEMRSELSELVADASNEVARETEVALDAVNHLAPDSQQDTPVVALDENAYKSIGQVDHIESALTASAVASDDVVPEQHLVVSAMALDEHAHRSSNQIDNVLHCVNQQNKAKSAPESCGGAAIVTDVLVAPTVDDACKTIDNLDKLANGIKTSRLALDAAASEIPSDAPTIVLDEYGHRGDDQADNVFENANPQNMSVENGALTSRGDAADDVPITALDEYANRSSDEADNVFGDVNLQNMSIENGALKGCGEAADDVPMTAFDEYAHRSGDQADKVFENVNPQNMSMENYALKSVDEARIVADVVAPLSHEDVSAIAPVVDAYKKMDGAGGEAEEQVGLGEPDLQESPREGFRSSVKFFVNLGVRSKRFVIRKRTGQFLPRPPMLESMLALKAFLVEQLGCVGATAFKEFDRNSSGHISTYEWEERLGNLGYWSAKDSGGLPDLQDAFRLLGGLSESRRSMQRGNAPVVSITAASFEILSHLDEDCTAEEWQDVFFDGAS